MVEKKELSELQLNLKIVEHLSMGCQSCRTRFLAVLRDEYNVFEEPLEVFTGRVIPKIVEDCTYGRDIIPAGMFDDRDLIQE